MSESLHRLQREEGPGALVANHCSWFDIVALNARRDVYFVAKSEVSRWPPPVGPPRARSS